MEHMEWSFYEADHDVWIRKGINSEGNDYYEYLLLYTDDCLCISENVKQVVLLELNKYFKLKPSSIGPPNIYLGVKVSKVTLENDI